MDPRDAEVIQSNLKNMPMEQREHFLMELQQH